MSGYVKVKRDGKWEVLRSHVNGEDLIQSCKTKKQADDLIKILERKH